MKTLGIALSLLALLAACGSSSGSGENPLQGDVDCVRDNPLQACESSGNGEDGSDIGDVGTADPDGVPGALSENLAKFSFASDLRSVTVTGFVVSSFVLSLPQPLMTATEIKGSTVLAIVDNLNPLKCVRAEFVLPTHNVCN